MGHTALQDRADLTDLVYRLGACLDEHRFDELRDLLTDDVTATTPGGTATGIEATVSQATRNHHEFTGLQHLMTNVLVEMDEGADGADGADRATIRANVVGRFIRDGRRPEREIGGVYRFRSRRTAEGWRLSAIEVTPVWLVDQTVTV